MGRQDSGIAALAAQMTQTQSLIQSLLSEIRESSASQAALKTELRQLRHTAQVLSNIVRGGDGHNKPLLSEVEVLKHADRHLEKRMTKLAEDLERQLDDLAGATSTSTDRVMDALEKHRKEIDLEISAADTRRRDDETQRLQLEISDTKDLRLDSRQRLGTWATVIIAIISLIGTTIALIFK